MLSLAMMLGMLSGMGLTAYAKDDPSEWSSDKSFTAAGTFEEPLGVNVTADITLTLAEGVTLTVSNGINASGHTLTVKGAGTLIVTGKNGTDGESGENATSGTDGDSAFTGHLVVNGATVNLTGGNGGNGGNDTDYSGHDESGNGGNGGEGVSGTVTLQSGTVSVRGGKGGDAGYAEERNGGTGGDGGIGVTSGITIQSGTLTVTGGAGGSGGFGGCSSLTYGGAGGNGGVGASDSIIVNGGSVDISGGNGGDGGTHDDTQDNYGTAGAAGKAITGTITTSNGLNIEESDDNSTWTEITSGTTSTKQYVKVESVLLDPVSYLNWDDTEQDLVEMTDDNACKDYTVVTDQTSWGTDGQETWYVLKENKTISNRITVNGTVNLILCDGATLTAPKGISVGPGKNLNIYAQSEGESKGALTINGVDRSNAGIGGNEDYYTVGNIAIYGGTVTATGGDYGAGIGGGIVADSGKVTIYGGTVTAIAGSGAAGIGSGIGYGAGNFFPSCGDVTIYGGNVTATGNYGGAGIGGGDCGNCGNVTIYNGNVTATGGGYGAGIGSGNGVYSSNNKYYGKKLSSGTITINGGTVIATGGSYGAGIGGGYYENGGTVTIKDGSVTANGGVGAMGIGMGYYSYGSSNGSMKVADTHVIFGNGTAITDDNKYYSEDMVQGTGEDSQDITCMQYMRVEKGVAPEKYPLWVGGKQVNSEIASNITGEETPTASYTLAVADDPATTNVDETAPATLTLNGYSYEGTGYKYESDGDGEFAAIYYGGDTDLTIHLEGTNSVKETGAGNGAGYGICAKQANLTISAAAGASLVVSGDTQAINGTVKNAFYGSGWTDSEGTTGKAIIDISTEGQTLDDYKKVEFPSAHNHSFNYSASGAAVTATCADKDGNCTLPPSSEGGTDHVAKLTIEKPTLTTYGQTGDSISAAATLDGLADFNSATGLEVSADAIKYYKATKSGSSYTKTGNALSAAPTDAGNYVAEITVTVVKDQVGTDYIASVGYTIAKANPTANAPTGLTATYGQTLADVSLEGKNPTGNTEGTWAWADSTKSVGGVVSPAATFKANFTPTDTTNYNSRNNVEVTVTVSKAENPATVTGTASVTAGGNIVDLAGNVTKNGATGDVSYAISGDANGCSLNGSVLTSGNTAGTVTVNVTVAADDNYNALTATPITVTINEKQTQTIIADDVTVTFGDTGKTITATTDGGGELSYVVKSGDAVTVDASTGALTIVKAGNAVITVTAAETATYAQATKDVNITVNQVNSSGKVTAVSGLVYDGTAKALVDSNVHGGIFMYRLGTDGEWTEDIPEAADFGTYTVYYYIKGDGNHKDNGSETEPMGSVDVTIKCPYSNEWVDGKWYNKNGSQTYKPLGDWKKDGKDWMYVDTSGWYPKNRWQKIDFKWYFFDREGHMLKDAYQKSADGKIWYVGKNGAWDEKAAVIGWKQDSKGWWFGLYEKEYLKSTWKMINGNWYYFKSDGYIAMNEFVQGWWLNKTGAWKDPVHYSWHKSGSKWWYGTKDGWYAKGRSYTIDGKKYTFDKKGYTK